MNPREDDGLALPERAKNLPASNLFGSLEGPQSPAAEGAAAKSRELVRARYVIAFARPRDMDEVRAKLLAACSRPRFAEGARYDLVAFNRGAGFNIRFAEEVMRCMTNLSVDVSVSSEGDESRVVHVSVSDLEANSVWDDEVVISKVVERNPRNLGGRVALRTRTNSKGEQVCLVAATEEEVASLQLNAVSRRARSLILRHVPTDILEECEDAIAKALSKEAASDPDKVRRKLFDAFQRLSITVADLKGYIRARFGLDDVGKLAVDEIVHLRQLYNALREGATTWRAIMAEVDAKSGASGDDDFDPSDPVAAARAAQARARAKPSQATAQEPPRSQAETSPAGRAAMIAEDGLYLVGTTKVRLKAGDSVDLAPGENLRGPLPEDALAPGEPPPPDVESREAQPDGFDEDAFREAGSFVWQSGENKGRKIDEIAGTDEGLLLLDYYRDRTRSADARKALATYLSAPMIEADLERLKAAGSNE